MFKKIGDFFKEYKVLSIFIIVSLLFIIFLPIGFLIKIILLAILTTIIFIHLNLFKTFFQKQKILAITSVLVFFIIILFVLGILFWAGKSIQVSMIDTPTERHYVDYMAGVLDPAMQMTLTSEDIEQMKEDNINTITIYPSTYLPSHLSFFYEFEKPYLIGVIKKAKKQGLAVRVSGQSGGAPPSEDVFFERRDLISDRVLEWAEISEELGVEYFSPWTEVDAMGFQRAVDWHSEILPKVRQKFSGKVFAGWACCSSDDVFTEDFLPSEYGEVHDESDIGQTYGRAIGFVRRIKASKDFDGVMLDYQAPTPLMMKYFFNSSKTKKPEDPYRPDSLQDIVKYSSQTAEEVGIPIYVGEFYVETAEGGFSKNAKVFNEEEQAEYIRKFLDMVMPHYDGVNHCMWSNPFSGGIKDKKAEKVIKEKYGKYT